MYPLGTIADRKLKEVFGQQLLDDNPGLQSQFEFVEKRFQEVKGQFLQGTKRKRVRGNWTPLSFVDLAKKSGSLGQSLFVLTAYDEPTQQAHSTTESILRRLQERDGRVIVGRRTEREHQAVSNVLVAAHGIVLQVLELQHEHFALTGCEKIFSCCDQDFKGVWKSNK